MKRRKKQCENPPYFCHEGLRPGEGSFVREEATGKKGRKNVGCVNPEGNNSPTHSRSGLSGPSGRGISVSFRSSSPSCGREWWLKREVCSKLLKSRSGDNETRAASVVFGRLFIFPVFRFISP
uniref:(northern house mosquito) hypothetical protein n=1 Tax=Culex pipiens TaxID=7175 RepID=A0A8D8KT81_CULPI